MAYDEKFRNKFIDTFRSKLGNVTATCKQMNVDVTTFYKWKKDFPEFKEKVETIQYQEAGDYVESKLFERIKDGDTTAIIFALKTRFRGKGYSTQVELTGANGTPILQNVEVPKEVIKKAIKDFEKECNGE